MWEYCRISIDLNKINDIEDILNNYGLDGWEIIHYREMEPIKFGAQYNCTILFKRIKKSQQYL